MPRLEAPQRFRVWYRHGQEDPQALLAAVAAWTQELARRGLEVEPQGRPVVDTQLAPAGLDPLAFTLSLRTALQMVGEDPSWLFVAGDVALYPVWPSPAVRSAASAPPVGRAEPPLQPGRLVAPPRVEVVGPGPRSPYAPPRAPERRSDPEREWYLEWPVVIGALIGFWPLGLALLMYRLNGERAMRLAAGTALVVVGWSLVVFLALVIVVAAAEPKQDANAAAGIACLSVFALGGLFIAAQGHRLRGARDLTRRYVELIVNQQMSSVREVAEACGRGSDIAGVGREIHKVIDSGFLPGFTIDPRTGAITRPERPTSAEPEESAPDARQVAFNCEACGAHNEARIRGSVARCEYCDTPRNV